MLRGSSAARPSSVSGMPTSAAPSTSPARVAEALAELRAEHHRAHLARHAEQRRGHLRELGRQALGQPTGGQHAAHRLVDLAPRPARRSRATTGGSPRSTRCGSTRCRPTQVAGKVVTGSSHRVARSSACSTSRRSIAETDGSPSCATTLARGVASERPVDRRAVAAAGLQHLAELLERGAELRHVDGCRVEAPGTERVLRRGPVRVVVVAVARAEAERHVAAHGRTAAATDWGRMDGMRAVMSSTVTTGGRA